jgi:prefoldin subunit 5
MPDPDEVEKKIREMLIDMGDCRLLEEFEGAIRAYNERSCRIDETLEDLLQEVDELLLQMDELEASSIESDDDEI